MSRARDLGRLVLHALLVALGASALTLAFFLVLPLFQSITRPPETDLVLQSIETADVPPPPPPPPEEQPEEEPEPEPEPLELADEAPPLDLGQLELVLNPGVGDGFLTGDFGLAKLSTSPGTKDGTQSEELFALADLDQKPRALYQPSPVLDAAARRKTPGTVYVLFVVDARGRVERPVVQKSSDPVFEAPALAAVRQWKFEPGKRNGQAVRFRMRVPITFPKG